MVIRLEAALRTGARGLLASLVLELRAFKKQISYNTVFKYLKALVLLIHFMLPVLSKLILCVCLCVRVRVLSSGINYMVLMRH